DPVAFHYRVDPDDRVRSQLSAERCRSQAHRPQAGDQYSVVAADSYLLKPLVNRAEAAGHLRSVGIAQTVGQVHEVLLLGDHIARHPAVALPAVGAAESGVRAGDHVAPPAVAAEAASGDVVYDCAVTDPVRLAAGPHRDDLAARLVAGYNALVPLGPLAEMLVVDASNVRSADRGGLDPQEDLAVAGHGDRVLAELGRAVARKDGSLHRCWYGAIHCVVRCRP